MWQTSKWENIPAHLFALENVGKECSAGTLPNVLWAGEAKKKQTKQKTERSSGTQNPVSWAKVNSTIPSSHLVSLSSSWGPKKVESPPQLLKRSVDLTVQLGNQTTTPPPCINIHMPWKRRGSLHQHKIYSISPGWILMIRLIKSSLTTDSGQEIIIYSPAGLQLAIALHPHDFYSLSSACLIVLLILQQCAHPHNDLQWCQ